MKVLQEVYQIKTMTILHIPASKKQIKPKLRILKTLIYLGLYFN